MTSEYGILTVDQLNLICRRTLTDYFSTAQLEELITEAEEALFGLAQQTYTVDNIDLRVLSAIKQWVKVNTLNALVEDGWIDARFYTSEADKDRLWESFKVSLKGEEQEGNIVGFTNVEDFDEWGTF